MNNASVWPDCRVGRDGLAKGQVVGFPRAEFFGSEGEAGRESAGSAGVSLGRGQTGRSAGNSGIQLCLLFCLRRLLLLVGFALDHADLQ